MIFSLAVLGFSIWGITKIRVETKFIDYFRPSSEIYQGLEAVIPLPEIDVELPLAEVYEAVAFAPEPNEDEPG